jgi:hypothetical protein
MCRLLRVEMAVTESGSPASDRHEGDVDLRYLLEREFWTSVTRIPAAAGSLDEIAEGGTAMTAPRVSPAVVVGGQDAYP